jgi:hypothetical protein
MWSWVSELATRHFEVNLDAGNLPAVAVWKVELREKYSVDFPLPATNLTEAKQMRIIAVQFIIAKALTRHIFCPAGRDDTFAKIASAVAAEKPDLESFHRSTYLMMIEHQPGYKDFMIERAVMEVTNEIMDRVSSTMLSGERREQFRGDVENVCKDIAREWQGFQLCQEKYEADMSGDKDNYYPTPLWEGPANAKRHSPKVNGAEKKPGQDNSGHSQRGKQQHPSTSVGDAKVLQSTIVTAVWPSLRIPSVEGPIYSGWALFADQAKDAQEQAMRSNRHSIRNGAKQDEQKSSPRAPSLGAFFPALSKSG